MIASCRGTRIYSSPLWTEFRLARAEAEAEERHREQAEQQRVHTAIVQAQRRVAVTPQSRNIASEVLW